MRLLFVYDNLSIGGIQTLIVRLGKHLASNGHAVTVLLNRHGDPQLSARLASSCQLVVEKTTLNIPLREATSVAPEPDVIMAFDSPSLIEAVSLRKNCFPGMPVVAGVFHPREYCPPPGVARARDRLASRLFCELPPGNIAFMSEDCRSEHADRLGREFAASAIIPLPVDIGQYAHVDRSRMDRSKLVSIGRLTGFKTYNRTMIPVIAELNRNGGNYHYHIYGDGPDRRMVEQLISNWGVQDFVHLWGELPYAEMAKVLEDAFVFVGMGTSLIEASAAGVPSIVAIECTEEAKSYGLFHEMNDLNIGENVPGRPMHDIREILLRLRAQPEDYAGHCELARGKAESFALEKIAGQYLEWFASARHPPEEGESGGAHLPPWFGLVDLSGTLMSEALTCLGRSNRSGLRYLK